MNSSQFMMVGYNFRYSSPFPSLQFFILLTESKLIPFNSETKWRGRIELRKWLRSYIAFRNKWISNLMQEWVGNGKRTNALNWNETCASAKRTNWEKRKKWLKRWRPLASLIQFHSLNQLIHLNYAMRRSHCWIKINESFRAGVSRTSFFINFSFSWFMSVAKD